MSPIEQSRWFADEVKPHEPMLRGYLSKRFPSLPDHDDIVQEVYSRLMRVAGNGEIPYTKGFLFTVARNLAIDMLRRRQKVTLESISDITEMPALEETPGVVDALERQRRLDVLIEAIASLPERCREVAMLRHLDGLSYKEIAAQLEISPNTVKLHIVKGVRDCTAFFRAKGLLDTNPTPNSVSSLESQSL
jgi:RNA polymerase sigma-70 factor (ECF subfamily)